MCPNKEHSDKDVATSHYRTDHNIGGLRWEHANNLPSCAFAFFFLGGELQRIGNDERFATFFSSLSPPFSLSTQRVSLLICAHTHHVFVSVITHKLNDESVFNGQTDVKMSVLHNDTEHTSYKWHSLIMVSVWFKDNWYFPLPPPRRRVYTTTTTTTAPFKQ